MVTLILTAVQLRLDYNDGIDVIHQRIKQIELTNVDSIIQSLWTIDNSSIQIQLDGLSRINDIIYVEIIDVNGKLISSSGEIATDDIIESSFQLHQVYRGVKNPLGTLHIVATKENVYQHLIDTVIVILISQAIKTFLVSMFVLFIFYYLVSRHLKKIANYTETLDVTSPSSMLQLDRNGTGILQGDELDLVVDALNGMSDKIYHSYEDLKENKFKLSEREAKFTTVFDSIADAIVITDCDRKIMQTNTAFKLQFGYDDIEVIGKTTSLLYANQDEYELQGKERFSKDAKISTPSLYEIDYRRKDGSIFPSETMGGAVSLADGTQLGYIGIVRDITYRKQEEAEKAILQKELQQAQKMEAIGQLTGGIAHDFNNMLASVLGYSELALNTLQNSSDVQLIQYVKRINIAGERARELVAQLLAFSRSAPSDPRQIKLSELIDDVTALVRPTIPTSIKLILDIQDNVPSVLMDSTQMHQILMNLCINARDAMDGSGELTIKLSYQKQMNANCSSCNDLVQGDYVSLTVTDTGSGIEPDVLGNIFDPFLTTKGVGKGTGMGLSVVHGILHKHQSHIIVKTELGVGSSFQVLLPPNGDADALLGDEKAPANELSKDTKDKHILIVDDEEAVAAFLQDFLQSYGYKITSTTSSKKAIELLEASPEEYDLVVTDQTMPEMTGVEMIKHLFEIRPDIPVILCSGYSEQVDEAQALSLGCAKYMSKPINNQDLIEAIQETIGAD